MLAGLKEVVEEGKKRNIAIGSFNTPNLECLLAVLDAAEELNERLMKQMQGIEISGKDLF